MTLSIRLIPIAAAAAFMLGVPPAAAADGFAPSDVVQVGDRHWHRHHHRHGWGPPGHWRHAPPPAYHYAPPPRVYYAPPRIYYAPPPPPRYYYYAPPPSVGLYFRF